MKYFLIIIFFIATAVGYAQLPNKFQIRLGLGYSNILMHDVTPGIQSGDNDIEQAFINFPIGFRFEVVKRLNVGLDFLFGVNDNFRDKLKLQSRLMTAGLCAEYSIIDLPDFRWYAGVSGGGTKIKYSQNLYYGMTGVSAINSSWSGTGFRFATGIQFFNLGPSLGVQFNATYDMHHVSLKDASGSGSVIVVSRSDSQLNLSGIGVNLGIVWLIQFSEAIDTNSPKK